MSFVTRTKVKYKDMETLTQSILDLGGKVRKENKFKAHEGWMSCERAFEFPGVARSYGAGIVREDKHTFSLSYDTWGDGANISKALGRDNDGKLTKLDQRYAVNETFEALSSMGSEFTMVEDKATDSVVLEVEL
jgi:hypothetical protein